MRLPSSLCTPSLLRSCASASTSTALLLRTNRRGRSTESSSSAAADFLSRETILLVCNRVLLKKNWGAQKLVFGEDSLSGGWRLSFLSVVPTSYLFCYCRQVLIFFSLVSFILRISVLFEYRGRGFEFGPGFRYNCFFSWTSRWICFDCSWLLFFVWVLLGWFFSFFLFWYWLSLLFRPLLRFCFWFFLCSLGLSFSSLSCLIYVVRSENLSNPIVNRSSINFVPFEFNRKYEELLSTYEDFFGLKNSCAWQNPNISTSSLLYLV